MLDDACLTSCVFFCVLCWLVCQVFRDALPYEIGTKSSSNLVYLQIANTTYIQYPNISRRYLELQGASTSSLNCSGNTSGSSCIEWYSLALFDAKWTLQAQVSCSMVLMLEILVQAALNLLTRLLTAALCTNHAPLTC